MKPLELIIFHKAKKGGGSAPSLETVSLSFTLDAIDGTITYLNESGEVITKETDYHTESAFSLSVARHSYVLFVGQIRHGGVESELPVIYSGTSNDVYVLASANGSTTIYGK